ncbi:MAG: 3'-5' exonuclease domain-containing protein 2 [Bacteroidetes bacterium]|nr:3'-5' exonuclease domain-containing protein 2 [Bacteroidota bacterium]
MNPFADRSSVSSEEIQTLPYGAFEGRSHVVANEEDLLKALRKIRDEKILGFDTETRPTFKKGQFHRVALLQLSTHREAWLIRLHDTGLPEELLDILEDETISKCGVAIRDDLKALQKIKMFEPAGFIELATLAKQKGLEVEGLRKLAAILLGIRISKSAQTSNWEVKNLSEKQIQYAATDAWVCLEIFHRLSRKKDKHHHP